VIFGTNISNASVSDVRYDSPSHFADAYICDNQYKEVSCTTLPKKYTDTHMAFICRYCIPKEADDLKYLRFDPYEDNMPKVRLINYKIL
jgi:hypothetical protein